jgi:hypothetical protein
LEAFAQGELPPQQFLDALDEVAVMCKERGIQIIVDAESQHWQKGISRTSLELMRKFNTDGKRHLPTSLFIWPRHKRTDSL